MGGNLRDLYAAAVSSASARTVDVHLAPLGAFGNAAGRAALNRRTGAASLALPNEDNATGRTIRAHEAAHVNLDGEAQPRRRSAKEKAAGRGVANSLEDVRVHLAFARVRRADSVGRDILATALRDIRKARGLASVLPSIAAMPGGLAPYWESLASAFVRSAAIAKIELDAAGDAPSARNGWRGSARFQRAGRGLIAWAQTLYGPQNGRAMGAAALEAVEFIRRRRFTRAAETLAPLFALPAEGRAGAGGGEGDGEAHKHETENRPGLPGEGRQPLRILEPARTVDVPGARTRVAADTGRALRASQLVPAALRLARRPFKRTRRRPPTVGAFLLDASGSMGVTPGRIDALLSAAPGAVAAFYSGPGNVIPGSGGAWGDLVIYAADGRRVAPGTAPDSWGGNEVDLYAVRWLLEQPAPRVLVSDLQFCGGPSGQETYARRLVREAVADGRLTVYKSLANAARALGLSPADMPRSDYDEGAADPEEDEDEDEDEGAA